MASLASPAVLLAQGQQGEELEEVVVTGSYIRNSAFAQNSPVDTVSQADLHESGSLSMADYIRDLTYTQNTNTVHNVLAGSSGNQSSYGTTFNLRGLGENSTLTLMDGVRSINNSITALVPDIAIERMEVVLDGGSALYGSDAVSGVVNIIPIKEFDGVRTRLRFQRPGEGGFEEGNASLLAGTRFDNGINVVGAVDIRYRTRLGQHERPREWMMDDGSSASGHIGAFRELEGGTVNLGGPHGGEHVGDIMLDPSCGTFNEGREDRTQKGNTPSGVPQGTTCRYQYTNTYPYASGMEEYNLYLNATYEATDWLELEATGNWNYLTHEHSNGVVTALNSNNRAALVIPEEHPANPYGTDVSPWYWRPDASRPGRPEVPRPDFIDEFGHTSGNYDDSSNRIKLGARFDISSTWSGYAYYSRQERKDFNRNPRSNLNLHRLQLALAGEGGPNGNEYYNPFGSADPRSPYYEEGVTDNSRELYNWMWHDWSHTTDREYLDIAEATVTGEVVDLPHGTLSMAVGVQRRDIQENSYANPLAKIGQRYLRSIDQPPAFDTRYFSETQSAFLEIEAPILPNLAIQAAVRREDFTDFDMQSTTPKVAMRWEAFNTLSLRASWGESFLAPTPTQARPFIPDENCGEVHSGNDPFLGIDMVGAFRCASGNPGLQPETSEIWNLGGTWEPIDDLSISLDYQEVTYEDRIRTVLYTDAVWQQFDEFLAQHGGTRDSYDPTPGSADRQAATAYLTSMAGTQGNPVVRNEDLTIDTIYTQAQNISSVYINLLDLNVDYRYTTRGWGTFGGELTASHYLNYEYADLATDGNVNALGMQNRETGIVPPLPQIKASARLNWFRDRQSASVTANYRHHVEFDGRPIDRYGDGWLDMVPRLIESETVVNMQYAHVLDEYFNIGEFTVSAGVSNVFNTRPQQLPIQGGFESRLSVPWGRQYWASIDWRPRF